MVPGRSARILGGYGVVGDIARIYLFSINVLYGFFNFASDLNKIYYSGPFK